MVEPGAAEPTITGVCDSDRGFWGDPLADWTVYCAGQRPGTERDAFWETYGRPVMSPAAAVRSQIYLARHIVSARLERHRLGKAEEIAASYDELQVTIRHLA
jgi:hypothetical protein